MMKYLAILLCLMLVGCESQFDRDYRQMEEAGLIYREDPRPKEYYDFLKDTGQKYERTYPGGVVAVSCDTVQIVDGGWIEHTQIDKEEE